MDRGKTTKSSIRPAFEERDIDVSDHPGSQDTASAPVLGTLEAAKVLSTLADILAMSPISVLFGEKSIYSDPICEALRRVIERKAPLMICRELIPGNPESTETFDVRKMIMDWSYACACLDFRRDSSIPESGMNYKEILERLGEWKKPVAEN